MFRPDKKKVEIPTDVIDALDSIADAMDVATAPLAAAVLLGVARGGQVERFAQAGAAASPSLARALDVRRSRRPRRRWTRVDDPADTTATTEVDGRRRVMPRGSGVWSSDPWSIRYVGDPAAAKARRRGEGWHLFGPGIEFGIFLAHRRDDATEVADLHIDRWEAAQRSEGAP